MGEVVKLVPDEVGDGYRFDNDTVLEAAKGKDFSRLVLVGELPDGELYIAGSANAGESLVLMERAKLDIIGR